MKQGSTDDPFAEDDDEDAPGGEEAQPPADEFREDDVADDEAGPDSALDPRSGASGGVQQRRLPYIHSRDGVKDGRTQRPVFLRDHVESGIDELVDRMEAELGEDVYKTDVTEASMAVAQEHPELVLEKLEEWGYGWD